MRGPSQRQIAIAAMMVAAGAVAAGVLAVMVDGLVADAAVLLSLFMVVVALGLCSAAFLEWRLWTRSASLRGRRSPLLTGFTERARCRGCGSRTHRQAGIRVCPPCDLISTE